MTEKNEVIKLIKETKLTFTALAPLLGCSSQYLGLVSCGKRNLSAHKMAILTEIAEHMGRLDLSRFDK